jgi:hypothetical protein
MAVLPGKSAVVYRNRLEDWADKYLFLVLFCVGGGSIIAFKQLSYRQLIVTAAPVAVMLLYGIYVLFTPRYRVRNDRAGDSLYYLGFLYTLVSLAYSLYEFGGGGQTSTSAVVTNFGIALATTILGLMLRVVYHQLREDPFDVEQEARVELADTASRLRGVLLSSVNDFDGLRLAMGQVLQEGTETTRVRIGEATAALVKSSQEQRDLLTDTTKTLSQQLAEQHNELVQRHKELLESSRKVAAAAKQVATRIDNIDIPEDALKVRLDAVATKLEEVIAGIAIRAKREADTTAKLQSILDHASGVAESLNAALRSFVAVAHEQQLQVRAAILELERTIEAIKKSAANIVTQSEEHVQTHRAMLDELSKSSSQALQLIDEHRKQLESEVRKSSAAVAQVQGSLISLTKTVVEKLDGRA